MASYPDSVKSFTTKNSGDVIQAAHVNDIQSEVNAIESGLLNGTARLQSSVTQMVSLRVTGGSTLQSVNVVEGLQTSTLTVLDQATFNSSVTFASYPNITGLPNKYTKIFQTDSGTIGSSALSTIAWGSISINLNSSLYGVNNNFLSPDSTGIWRLVAQVTMASPTTTARGIEIRDSSGTVFGEDKQIGSSVGTLQASADKNFNVTGGNFVVVFLGDGASTWSVTSGLRTWATLEKI